MGWSRFFRRKQWDVERARELDTYLEIETRENIARGLTPEQARTAANRKLGNSTLIREEIYRMNTISFLESLWQDVRYALRTLSKSPVFTLVIISSLALGIGANTAIFSLINVALLKMLPVRSPEQLVEFKSFSPVIGLNEAFAYPAFKRFHDQQQLLSGVFAFRSLNNVNVEVNGQSALANGHAVSGDYFSVLGVNALLGRTITAEDEKIPGESPVAVIGYDYWRERFALDPAVIGKNIVLNNSPFTIIGVAPPEFFGLQPGQRIDVFVPLTMIAQAKPGWAMPGTPYDVFSAPFRNWLNVMGRLKPRRDDKGGRCQPGGWFPPKPARGRARTWRYAGRFGPSSKGFHRHHASPGSWWTRTRRATAPILETALDHHGRRGFAASRHLRERCQFIAGAGQRASKRNRRKTHSWGRKAALDSPVDYREHSARAIRWRSRFARRFLGR